MTLFTKENGIKLFAIVIVFAFLLELFAFQRNSDIPIDTGQTDGSQTTTTANLFGIALANATVTSYGDALGSSITAEGDAAPLEAEAAKLKSEGLISYTSKTQKGLVFNLPKGANFTEVVKRLSALNATLTARAEISVKGPLVFYTENGPVEVAAKNFRITLDPSIPIGYLIGLKMKATLSDDRIVESAYEITPIQKDILVVGEPVKLYSDYIAIGVLEWENRVVDRNATTAYLSQNFSNVSVQLITNNSVEFSKPISQEGLDALVSLNLSYAKSENRNGMLLMVDFSDKAKLEGDIGPVLSVENVTLGYPLSYARIDFVSDTYPQGLLNSSLDATAFFLYRKATIRVGESVSDDEGKRYSVLSRDYTDLFPYINETGMGQLLTMRANILGDKILNYTVPEG